MQVVNPCCPGCASVPLALISPLLQVSIGCLRWAVAALNPRWHQHGITWTRAEMTMLLLFLLCYFLGLNKMLRISWELPKAPSFCFAPRDMDREPERYCRNQMQHLLNSCQHLPQMQGARAWLAQNIRNQVHDETRFRKMCPTRKHPMTYPR